MGLTTQLFDWQLEAVRSVADGKRCRFVTKDWLRFPVALLCQPLVKQAVPAAVGVSNQQ